MDVTDQLDDIMGHFNEARSVVIACQRSLDSLELARSGDESEALLVAIELLRQTDNEPDAFAARCTRLVPVLRAVLESEFRHLLVVELRPKRM
jgi:hypothetical protein